MSIIREFYEGDLRPNEVNFKNKKYFPLQKMEKELKDGRIVLSCKAAKEEEILPTILHWLPHIKVVSPASLHKHVKEVLTDYLRSVK